MSIPGVSGVSSAAYFQQLQNIGQTNTSGQTNATGQAATAQTPAAIPADFAVQAGSTQQPDQVRHHHHHGGGDVGTPSGPTQSGTTAAGGTSLLNTLV